VVEFLAGFKSINRLGQNTGTEKARGRNKGRGMQNNE
jgi:hypothetical protein